jgi:hypothetical protein
MTSLSYDPDRADVDNTAYVQGTLSVSTSAVEAKVSTSALSNRQSVLVYNSSNATIYAGPLGVTTSTGIAIFKNQFFSLPLGQSNPLYLIAASGSNTVVIGEIA